MSTLISLDTVHKLVEHKTGKKVKLVSNIGGQSNLLGCVEENIELSEFYFDKEFELVVKDTDGNEVGKELHCILLHGDFVDYNAKQLSLTGIKNGVLVIDNECVTNEDLEFLVHNN